MNMPAPDPYGSQHFPPPAGAGFHPHAHPGAANRSQRTVPRGFVGVVVASVVYVLAYPASLVLQLAYGNGEFFQGRTTPVTQAEVITTICIIGVVTFLLCGLPAILITSGPGTRPFGRALSARLVWIPAVLSLGLVAATVTPTDEPPDPGFSSSGWSSFLTLIALLVAWMSTRRASKWALLAAPVGGLVALGCTQAMVSALNGLSESTRPGNIYEQLDATLSGTETPYGGIFFIVLFSRVGVVAALVGAAWLGFGIDRLVTSVTKHPLSQEPVSMWDNVSAERWRALLAAASALSVALLIPATAAMGSGNWQKMHVASGVLGIVVCTLLAVGISSAAPQERRPLALGAVAAMTVFAVVIGVFAILEARGGTSAWPATLCRHLFLAACAAGFIVVLAKSLWALLATPLVFAAPWSGLPDTPPAVYSDAAGTIAIDAFLLAATVALGLGLSWVAGYVRAHPEMFASAGVGPTPPPPLYGPPPYAPPPYGPPQSRPFAPQSGPFAPPSRGFAPQPHPAPAWPTPQPGPSAPHPSGPLPPQHAEPRTEIVPRPYK
uniref:hypothetical protein n=1 Tax=Gordonia sp. B7-2 TaxID=3420932 RepID=UPI003D8DD431